MHGRRDLRCDSCSFWNNECTSALVGISDRTQRAHCDANDHCSSGCECQAARAQARQSRNGALCDRAVHTERFDSADASAVEDLRHEEHASIYAESHRVNVSSVRVFVRRHKRVVSLSALELWTRSAALGFLFLLERRFVLLFGRVRREDVLEQELAAVVEQKARDLRGPYEDRECMSQTSTTILTTNVPQGTRARSSPRR